MLEWMDDGLVIIGQQSPKSDFGAKKIYISPNDNFSPDPGGRVNPRTAWRFIFNKKEYPLEEYHRSNQNTGKDEIGQVVQRSPPQPVIAGALFSIHLFFSFGTSNCHWSFLFHLPDCESDIKVRSRAAFIEDLVSC